MATLSLGKPDAAPGANVLHDLGGKFLTFRLAEEDYGVQILKVRELIGMMEITSVPQMPPFMKGVINLRGKVIPVVDLRLKFGFQEIAHTEQTCIIVVDVGKEVGIVVDTVSEVLDIAGDQVEPPPSMEDPQGASFILGMGKVNDDVTILLDLDNVLSTGELGEVMTVLSNNPGLGAKK